MISIFSNVLYWFSIYRINWLKYDITWNLVYQVCFASLILWIYFSIITFLSFPQGMTFSRSLKIMLSCCIQDLSCQSSYINSSLRENYLHTTVIKFLPIFYISYLLYFVCEHLKSSFKSVLFLFFLHFPQTSSWKKYLSCIFLLLLVISRDDWYCLRIFYFPPIYI